MASQQNGYSLVTLGYKNLQCFLEMPKVSFSKNDV